MTKKTVKFPAKAIPMARLEKWKKAMADADAVTKKIQELQSDLVGKRAVADYLATELGSEFGLGPKDKVNLDTGEITKG